LHDTEILCFQEHKLKNYLRDTEILCFQEHKLRNYLRDTEILCFQEHKLRGVKLAALKDKIWRGATYFAGEADLAYNNTLDGLGGVLMGIAKYSTLSELTWAV
jgi:hypothetical protein